jgi:GDP-L-fucose synthase
LGLFALIQNILQLPFKEEDLWNGYPEETNAPYGLAKKNLLVGSQAFRQQYNRNMIHLIPVNMYGEHDHFDLENSHVIPAMLRKFHEAKVNDEMAVCLVGGMDQLLENFYTLGIVQKLFGKLFKKYDKADPINIGASKETSIKELAQIIKKIVGYEGEICMGCGAS